MVEQSEHHKKGQKYRQDLLSGILGGLIVMLLGVLFLLVNMGYLYWSNWWAYFLVGIGVILIIESIIRATFPQYSRPYIAKLIGGIILIFLGVGSIYGIGHWWPLILIGVGIAIIIGALWRRKSQ